MSRGTAYATWTESLIREVCCNCGMPFAMASTFHQQRVDDGKTFTCPAGHQQHYTGKEEREKELERRLDRAKNRASRAESRATHLQDQYDAERRSKAAIKGHLTRIKRRIANGVCPCCQRSFKNVRDHMEDKHPDFMADLVQRERDAREA